MERRLTTVGLFLFIATFCVANQSAGPNLIQQTLTEPGATPFHLEAVITKKSDPSEHVSVEMFWMSPNLWRRKITSREFSQLLIVNEDKVFEEDSDTYFPHGVRTLVEAMVNPQTVLKFLRPSDFFLTMSSQYGPLQLVDAPGHSVSFTDYRPFKGRIIARLLIYTIGPGDSLRGQVTRLQKLKQPHEKFFSLPPLQQNSSRFGR